MIVQNSSNGWKKTHTLPNQMWLILESFLFSSSSSRKFSASFFFVQPSSSGIYCYAYAFRRSSGWVITIESNKNYHTVTVQALSNSVHLSWANAHLSLSRISIVHLKWFSGLVDLCEKYVNILRGKSIFLLKWIHHRRADM